MSNRLRNYYVDLNEYHFYFGQGFDRGYRDSTSATQVLPLSGTAINLGAILEAILHLEVVNQDSHW